MHNIPLLLSIVGKREQIPPLVASIRMYVQDFETIPVADIHVEMYIRLGEPAPALNYRGV